MRAGLEDYFRFPIGLPIAGSVVDPHSLGYVYIIGFEEPGIVKIGSAISIGLRLMELQCGNPFELHVRAVVSIYEGSPVLVERAAHRLAADHHIRGEWFSLTAEDALAVVIKAARNKKAKFGSYAGAYEKSMQRPDWEGIEAQSEAERRRILRRKLGMEDA